MKVLSGEGIKDFALLGIFQIVRGQKNVGDRLNSGLPFFVGPLWVHSLRGDSYYLNSLAGFYDRHHNSFE